MYFSGKTWNNGSRHSSGAGYGIKLSLLDREANFSPDWGIVLLFLEGNDHPIEVNVAKRSFWSKKCGELIHKEIGLWFQQKGISSWDKGKPYNVYLYHLKDNQFKVSVKPQSI
jgi:hypothetical protein